METIKENWNELKHYYALVEGVPEKTEVLIKSWLIEDKSRKCIQPGKSAAKVFHYEL